MGVKTLTTKENPWWIQVYWPAFKFRGEFYAALNCLVRITSRGFGFEIFGFGFGIVYSPPKPRTTHEVTR